MKISKNNLDERQRQRRNSIGNQMFMLMFWVILLNCGLNGAGITWLKYPADIIVIISVCMFIYLGRLIASGSYLPENETKGKNWANRLVILIMATIAITIIAVSRFTGADKPWSDTATIFTMVVAVGSIIAQVTLIINKIRDNDKGDD